VSDVSQDVLDRLQRLLPREARSAYFQRDKGDPFFIYNTERIHTRDPNDVADGKFESAMFVPFGPGSRSGKATKWKVDPESRSLHTLRKDAKARALRLYDEWCAAHPKT
jgi:hypothetical protein